jgi:hypothetical protein
MAEPNRETPETELRARSQRTIDLACEGARIELWVCAVNGFAQPVPGYDPNNKHLLRAQSNHR